MDKFKYFLLIIISLTFFFRVYAYYTNSFQRIVRWRQYDKEKSNIIEDKEGYRKQECTNDIIMGALFLSFIGLTYLVDKNYLHKNFLSFGLFIIVAEAIVGHLKTRKYIKYA